MNDNSSLRVLVVDDERPIRRFLHTALAGHYLIFEAENGAEALQMVAINRPDLVLLDMGLPDMDGLEVTRRLREWSLVPIIVVSVRDREQDKVAALDAGADDYLCKPFSIGELMARMRAAMRHFSKPENEPFYKSSGLTANLSTREILVGDVRIALTPTEYDILRILITHVGKVLTHHQLIQAVWGDGSEADAHLLRVNISNLRKKIERDPLRPYYILTEPGVGYRLKEEVDQ